MYEQGRIQEGGEGILGALSAQVIMKILEK